MSRFNEEKVREILSQFHEEARQTNALYADAASRERLLCDAREQIWAAHGSDVPFAFSTSKGVDSIFSVRRDLAGALDAARSGYAAPSSMIFISAWFPDGSSYGIPWEFLCRFHGDLRAHEWLSGDEARQLATDLFGPEAIDAEHAG